MDAMNKRAQLREVRLPTVDIDQQTSADGTVLLRSLLPLRDFDANIVRSFLKVCSEQPTKTIYAHIGTVGVELVVSPGSAVRSHTAPKGLDIELETRFTVVLPGNPSPFRPRGPQPAAV